MTDAALQILIALAAGGKHGYAILREVNERTAGSGVPLYPGTLYANVKRLLDEGLVREGTAAEPGAGNDDERRRYYRLTAKGRKAASAEIARLESILRAARASGLATRRVPS